MSYEDMRALEDSMSKDEIAEALAIGRANGWSGEAPEWVWRSIFCDVIARRKDQPK